MCWQHVHASKDVDVDVKVDVDAFLRLLLLGVVCMHVHVYFTQDLTSHEKKGRGTRTGAIALVVSARSVLTEGENALSYILLKLPPGQRV